MRIGILFIAISIVVAGACAAVALEGHPLALVGIWPALAFMVVGMGYAGLGARVFGKRTNGTLRFSTWLLLLPYLIVSWLVWRVLRMSKERCWDEVARGIYLGRRPYEHELPSDVRLIVDLTAEFGRSVPHREGLDYVCVPTLDGHVPSEPQVRELVSRIVAHRGPSYIHCAQGHGRSAVVAGALLMAKGIVETPQEAENLMKKARPGVSLSRAQRALLVAFK